MTNNDFSTQASERLRQAIAAGMVVIDHDHRTATICAPPSDDLTDDEWLNVLMAASEVEAELVALGYNVKG